MSEMTSLMINDIKLQAKKLDLIEDNIVEVNQNMKDANQELAKTEQNATNNNNLFKWISLLFGILVVISVFVYILFYRRSS